MRVERHWSSAKVIEALADVMVIKGVPEHLRSDNGPESSRTIYANGWRIQEQRRCTSNLAQPWENRYCERFNSKMRDEFLSGEIFYSIKELRVLAERWSKHYNIARAHSSLGYRPPAPEAWLASTVRRQEQPVAWLPTLLPPYPASI